MLRTPRDLWACTAAPADDLDDLRVAVRAYLALPGARTITPPGNAPQRPRESPLERALTPAHTTAIPHL